MPSGLTGATREHPAEYLMDNVEAARGLADYARLLGAVLDDPVGRRPDRRGRRDPVRRGGRALDGSARPGMYGWAADRLSPSWGVWYPDSVAQLWPVWDGLGPAAAGARRCGRGSAGQWPDWAASTPEYGDGSVDHDPNASSAYAAARVGDKAASTPTCGRPWSAGRPAAAVDRRRLRVPGAGRPAGRPRRSR